MKDEQSWDLKGVLDRDLHIGLAQLLTTGCRIEARILAHLSEIEERRLHLESGSSSLFDYCVHRLGLSNSEAFHRITAARLASRFPLIFSLIERRDLHLSGVCMLRDYLTTENHVELLTAASHKTKWQIQELLASRFPRAEIPSTIRKLPPVRPLALPATWTEQVPLAVTKQAIEARALGTASHRAAAKWEPEQTQTPTPLARQRLEPAAEARYRLQLDMSASLREKLERARDLLSHSIPDRDIATVLERALDELLDKVQRQRFAQTKSRAQGRSISLRVRPRGSASTNHREHVPNAVRREIVARDGLRCSFVTEGGARCDATSFLQIHHERPWARGGDASESNLRLLCAAHNGLLAERDFGPAHVKARREARRSNAELQFAVTDSIA